MVVVRICVGSSCHLKGAPTIVEMLEKKVADLHLEDEVILTGSFCFGRCNSVGVTVAVDDDIYVGVTPETLGEFWENRIMTALKRDGEL